MRHVTRANYRTDPNYPGVRAAVEQLLADTGVVSPVEVMIRTGRLQRAEYERWRRGAVPYLEREVSGSLEKLSRLLRILAFEAEARGLLASPTVYCRWGKGRRDRLRFSRSGEPALELAWSTCFVPPRDSKQSHDGAGSAPDSITADGEDPAPLPD